MCAGAVWGGVCLLGGFPFLPTVQGRWEGSVRSPPRFPHHTKDYPAGPSARELYPLPSLIQRHFSTFPGLWPLSLRSMCVASTYKEALGDRISRIRRDSHMSSSSNWYSKLYTFKCHQEREKGLSAHFAFQHPCEEACMLYLYWALKLW